MVPTLATSIQCSTGGSTYSNKRGVNWVICLFTSLLAKPNTLHYIVRDDGTARNLTDPYPA